MFDEGKALHELIYESQPTEAQEKIMELKKEKRDLKYELYQLRQRVDKLEQQDIEHRKCHATMNSTIMMQFELINALCDLTKGLTEDVARLSELAKEE